MSVHPWKRRLNRLDSSLRRWASGEPDVTFVGRLYDDLLCRPPDAGALTEGTRKLRLGDIRRGALRTDILASPEYRSVTPVRERRNWIREAPTPSTPRSLAAERPHEIWLEITTRCNVVPPCVMCGYAARAAASGGRRHMDPATWRLLLPLLRKARHIGLHGAGEPLLYPCLGDLLDSVGPGPVVGFNSNGHLLGRDAARLLVERGLGWISISLDAATARTYLRIRRRRDFDALLAKIRALRETRDAMGGTRPRIEINMTLMKQNLGEAPEFAELASRVGADGVMYQEMQPGGAQRVSAPDGWVFDYREQELARDGRRDEILAAARQRAHSLGLGFSCEILYTRGRPDTPPRVTSAAADGPPKVLCRDPWEKLLFDVDGNAFACCVHKANEIRLGTCPRDSVDAIWNGRRARLVREAMFGGSPPACCAGCFRTS